MAKSTPNLPASSKLKAPAAAAKPAIKKQIFKKKK